MPSRGGALGLPILAPLLVLIVFAAGACGGRAVIEDAAGQPRPPTSSASPADEPRDDEPEARAAPAAQTEPEAVDTAPAPAQLALVAQPSDPTAQFDELLQAERQEKADREAAQRGIEREIFDVLVPHPFDAASDNLPDPTVLTTSATGNTATITAAIALIDAPDQPHTLTAHVNYDTGYVHTLGDRAALRSAWERRTGQPTTVPVEPGIIETVALGEHYGSAWSRGIGSGYGGRTGLPYAQDRWYEGGNLLGHVDTEFSRQTPSEFWDDFTDVAPTASTDEQGRTIHRAELDHVRSSTLGFAAASALDRRLSTPGTVTTTTGSDGLVARVDITFLSHPHYASVSVAVDQRGGEIPVPAITDVLIPAQELVRSPRVETYTWIGTGTAQNSGTEPVLGPWTIDGRIHEGYPSLSMTAGDFAALAQLGPISAPEDQIVHRHGYESVIYTTGLFPELVPDWADPDVDAEQVYHHDPFRSPADVLPVHGEFDLWSRMRAVPEVVELADWPDYRVTRGFIDPDYWNYRSTQRDGIFGWIVSESSDEVFEVTIGADAEGRVWRFRLHTRDPDGGGLTVDIEIDPEPREFLDQGGRGIPTGLSVLPEWAAESAQTQAAAGFDEFFDVSREQVPAFDYVNRPDHLTIIGERVRDEPSGALDPGEEEYARWDSDFLRSADGILADDRFVVCFELEDYEWRYTENDLERFWRSYTDGTSLDDRLLRFNANGWVRVDVYATNGDRLASDPCTLTNQF
ncbi:MAG: hypothetical protein AAF567_04025 [Actinomycetota bacterium]